MMNLMQWSHDQNNDGHNNEQQWFQQFTQCKRCETYCLPEQLFSDGKCGDCTETEEWTMSVSRKMKRQLNASQGKCIKCGRPAMLGQTKCAKHMPISNAEAREAQRLVNQLTQRRFSSTQRSKAINQASQTINAQKRKWQSHTHNNDVHAVDGHSKTTPTALCMLGSMCLVNT